jgi:hypothetical protein
MDLSIHHNKVSIIKTEKRTVEYDSFFYIERIKK